MIEEKELNKYLKAHNWLKQLWAFVIVKKNILTNKLMFDKIWQMGNEVFAIWIIN